MFSDRSSATPWPHLCKWNFHLLRHWSSVTPSQLSSQPPHSSQSGALSSSYIMDLWQSLKSWFWSSCGCCVCCRVPCSVCQKETYVPALGLIWEVIILAVRCCTEEACLSACRVAVGGGPDGNLQCWRCWPHHPQTWVPVPDFISSTAPESAPHVSPVLSYQSPHIPA